MARIRATFVVTGARGNAREEFYGKLLKSYPKSFRIEDEETFSLSVKDDADPAMVKKMLRSYVPVDKMVSYHFKVEIDGTRLEFGGP